VGRSRDGCIKIGYVVIVERKGAGLGVNLGHPIVTMGSLLRSCAEVREPIELSFGVVSGVGPGLHVLDGVHVPPKERRCFEAFSAFAPPLV